MALPRFPWRSKASQRLAELARMSLFVDLSRRELKAIEAYLHERNFLAGEVIFDAGDEGQAIYFVLRGRVVICPPGRPDEVIAVLGPGEFFGELALLDDVPRVAQVRAVENCRLGVFFRGDFFNLLHAHAMIASKIVFQLARHLGARLRESARDRMDSTDSMDSP